MRVARKRATDRKVRMIMVTRRDAGTIAIKHDHFAFHTTNHLCEASAVDGAINVTAAADAAHVHSVTCIVARVPLMAISIVIHRYAAGRAGMQVTNERRPNRRVSGTGAVVIVVVAP